MAENATALAYSTSVNLFCWKKIYLRLHVRDEFTHVWDLIVDVVVGLSLVLNELLNVSHLVRLFWGHHCHCLILGFALKETPLASTSNHVSREIRKESKLLKYHLTVVSSFSVLNQRVAIFHIFAEPVVSFSLISLIEVKSYHQLALTLAAKEIIHWFNLEKPGAEASHRVGVKQSKLYIFRESVGAGVIYVLCLDFDDPEIIPMNDLQNSFHHVYSLIHQIMLIAGIGEDWSRVLSVKNRHRS